MMQLTPQIMEALSSDGVSGQRSDASLVVDGDALYIVHTSWMLLLMRPEDHVDPALLAWLREKQAGAQRSRMTDWRVLCARELDFEQGKFLPWKARGYCDIEDFSWASGLSYYTGQHCRNMLESQSDSLFGDVVDLTDIYQDGRARPVYAEKGEGRVGRTAATFWFPFDRRVVAVSAPWLAAFTDMGLRVLCPKESTKNLPPTLGLVSEDPDVFGFVSPKTVSGVRKDKKGRDIFGDASTVSWMPESFALGELAIPHLHDPSNVHDSLSECVDSLTHSDKARALSAVGNLRWNGWSDDSIRDAYLAARSMSYQTQYEKLMTDATSLLRELRGGDVTHWRVARVEKTAQDMCRAFEALQALPSLAGTQLDLGDLPEVIALLPKEKSA